MHLSDSERSAAYYDALAAQYDTHVTATATDVLARRAFIEIVGSEVPQGTTILDFGCGTGIDAKALAGIGYQVLAYDNSCGMLAQLQHRCASEIASGAVRVNDHARSLADSLAHWPRPDAVVANFAVLNMIGDLAPLFRMFADRLSPRGVIIMSVVNPQQWRHLATRHWWLGFRRRLRGMSPFYLTGHFTSYLHPVSAILHAASDFELIGSGTAGRMVRYDAATPGTCPRFWSDDHRGSVSPFRRRLWHSSAAPYLGTFTLLALRSRR